MWRRIGEGILRLYLVVFLIVDIIVFFRIMGQGDGFEGFIIGVSVFVGIGITILLSSVLLGVFFEMAKNLEVIAQNIKYMGTSLNGSGSSYERATVSNQSINLSATFDTNGSESPWICENCSTHNEAGALFCKDCGGKK